MCPIISLASYSPWDPLANTKHNKHMCLATDLDIKENQITLMDPYFAKVGEKITLDTFKKASSFYATYELSENNNLYKSNWKNILIENVERTFFKYYDNYSSASEAIKQFAEDFKTKWELNSHIDSYSSYWDTPLSDFLRQILLNRYRFQSLLSWTSENYNAVELHTLQTDYSTVISKWEMIFSLIAKSVLKNSLEKNKHSIALKIVETAEFENKVAIELIKILKNEQYIITEAIINNNSKFLHKKIVNIDLKSYYNNKGFGNEISNECDANLTGVGEYLLYEDNILESKPYKEFPVQFQKIKELRKDNISCDGQYIPISPNYFTKIIIVGCSEWGNFSDKLQLLYEKATIDISICFSDLSLKTPAFEEEIVWRGKTIDKNPNGAYIKQRDAKLYIYSKHIKLKGKLKGVILPNCPNIHIFSLAFETRS